VRLDNSESQFCDSVQCKIGLVSKDAGIPHVCTGVYIPCCCAGQSPDKSVLLLFRPFCTCSCTRCANQKLSSQCSAFTLDTVPQYHPNATERIATLRFAQQRKIALKKILEGCRSSLLFLSPDHNSGESYLIIHSDQTTKLSKAWAVTFLILPALLSMKVTSRQTHFSPWHLLKKGSCAKLYAILWQKVEKMFVEAVSSISIYQIWIPNTSDSQPKNSFPLYLCVPVSESRKN
jgi:hypothetical protein